MKISLKPEEEVVGVYKELRITPDSIVIFLQSVNGKEAEISFPVELVKPEIIRKKFRSINMGENIGILRITDAKRPVLIRKLQDGKTAKIPRTRIDPQKPTTTQNFNETTVAHNKPLALLGFRSSVLGVAFKGSQLVALKFALVRLGLRLW